MTVQDVVNAIAGSLNGIDSSKLIYQEHTEQNFNTPCFYIHTVGGSRKDLTGNMGRVSLQYDIQFHPDIDGTEQQQCNTIADKLLEQFDYVMAEGRPLRVNAREYDIVDRILHFMISINANVELQVEPEDSMATLAQESGTKG